MLGSWGALKQIAVGRCRLQRRSMDAVRPGPFVLVFCVEASDEVGEASWVALSIWSRCRIDSEGERNDGESDVELGLGLDQHGFVSLPSCTDSERLCLWCFMMVMSVIAGLLGVCRRIWGYPMTDSCGETSSSSNSLPPECKHDVVVQLGVGRFRREVEVGCDNREFSQQGGEQTWTAVHRSESISTTQRRPLVLKMDSGHPQPAFADYLEDLSDEDNESLASLETDDGQDHPPEKILAQYSKPGQGIVWFLVKWQDCPLLRSSWEDRGLFTGYPWILEAWQVELQQQAEGKSNPFDIHAFDRAVLEVEKAERQRRKLRRLKRRINRVLSIVTP